MLIATKKEMTIFIFPFNSSSTASSTRCPHIRYLRAIHCSALLFLSIRRSTHIILDLFYFFYFKNTSGGSVSVLILHISRPNKVRWSSTTQTYPEWYTQLNAVHIFYKNGLYTFRHTFAQRASSWNIQVFKFQNGDVVDMVTINSDSVRRWIGYWVLVYNIVIHDHVIHNNVHLWCAWIHARRA